MPNTQWIFATIWAFLSGCSFLFEEGTHVNLNILIPCLMMFTLNIVDGILTSIKSLRKYHDH